MPVVKVEVAPGVFAYLFKADADEQAELDRLAAQAKSRVRRGGGGRKGPRSTPEEKARLKAIREARYAAERKKQRAIKAVERAAERERIKAEKAAARAAELAANRARREAERAQTKTRKMLEERKKRQEEDAQRLAAAEAAANARFKVQFQQTLERLAAKRAA